MKKLCFFFVLWSRFLSANPCDIRLDQKIFNAQFSWAQDGRPGMVSFDKLSPSRYRVAGVYTYEEGVYSYDRNFLVAWPDESGRDTLFIKEISFYQSENGQCRIVFASPHNDKSFDAGVEETQSGLNILWQETTEELTYF